MKKHVKIQFLFFWNVIQYIYNSWFSSEYKFIKMNAFLKKKWYLGSQLHAGGIPGELRCIHITPNQIIWFGSIFSLLQLEDLQQQRKTPAKMRLQLAVLIDFCFSFEWTFFSLMMMVWSRPDSLDSDRRAFESPCSPHQLYVLGQTSPTFDAQFPKLCNGANVIYLAHFSALEVT